MSVDWRKWGLGGSLDFTGPLFLRLWLGPIRVGWSYGRGDTSMRCPECKGRGSVPVDAVTPSEAL